MPLLTRYVALAFISIAVFFYLSTFPAELEPTTDEGGDGEEGSPGVVFQRPRDRSHDRDRYEWVRMPTQEEREEEERYRKKQEEEEKSLKGGPTSTSPGKKAGLKQAAATPRQPSSPAQVPGIEFQWQGNNRQDIIPQGNPWGGFDAGRAVPDDNLLVTVPDSGPTPTAAASSKASITPATSTGPKFRYKPTPTASVNPIKDPWPLLSSPRAHAPPPPGPNNNRDTSAVAGDGGNRFRHAPEATPLLIGFTRNWPLLLQCVASYIAAGWPPEDVMVVENTGAMRANAEGKLSLQNPFFLNHTQLRMLGVNVVETPALLTFSQLQNFYSWTALENGWPAFFWSHQDVVVFSYENITSSTPADALDGSSPPIAGAETAQAAAAWTNGEEAGAGPAASNSPGGFLTLYERCLLTLRALNSRPKTAATPRWANHFFGYDHLTLTNVEAVRHVGGWDAHIPFYAADCDMYDRLLWAGFWQGEASPGVIFDVAEAMDDLGAIFRLPGTVGRLAGDPPPLPETLLMDTSPNPGRAGGPGSETTGHRRPPRPNHDADDDDDERDDDELARRSGPGLSSTSPETWEGLVALGARMQARKQDAGPGSGALRNGWQTAQRGGRGEALYRDPDGFERGVQLLIETGRRVFAEKWGHRGCSILDRGLGLADAWRVERDWDDEEAALQGW